MVSSAVSSVLYLRDAAGEHTEIVWVRMSTTETQQASTNENSENVFALHTKQGTTSWKECQKYVTDSVVMHSLQPKKSGFTLSAELSTLLLLAASTHLSDTCVTWSCRSLNTNPKNCFASTVVQEDHCQENKANA